jgi:hypothetical protein
MRYVPGVAVLLSMVAALCLGCGQGRSLNDIHAELQKKLERETTVVIDWGREQGRFSALPESGRERFQNSFCGKKVRASVRVKEFKTADMTLFQRAFEGFDYHAKERFNFDNLMVVIGNGPNYGAIETSYVVFLPQAMLFDFNKGQEIAVEGLVDSVSFTFYNCHILLYPARLAGR